MAIGSNIILDAGLHREMPAYLRKRIRPTNIICLLVFFVLAIPFSLISLYHFPKMAFFPAGGGAISLLVIFINKQGGIYYSRLLLPIVLMVLASLYNAFFSTSISDGITSVFLVELSFTLIPFVVFDYRETSFLLACGLFSAFILVGFPFFWPHFDMGYNGQVLREGWLAVLTVMLAVASQIGAVWGLSYLNKQSEDESYELLKDVEGQKQVVEDQKVELEHSLKELEDKREEEEKRQWVAGGIAKISDVIRRETDQEKLFDYLLSTIVKYIGALQGALFIAEHANETNGEHLEMVACYAYERKKFLKKTVMVGEGLVGQTYLEKIPSYYSEMPNDYVNITSGLGEGSPRCIMIIPLLNNDMVEGILEIASFKPIEDKQKKYMEEMSGTLAAHVYNTRTMRNTKMLLQESQEQSEELKAAEEEMRQNQEELQAIQEQLTRENRAMQENSEARERELLTEIEQLQQEIKRLKQLVSTSTTS